jgi:3-hydroxyacyl-CoA dehydrogenase/enoyl-CoA hydratase/3-hydroxybutyryl-CoA epimerase
MTRLTVDLAAAQVASADVVIEAIIENADAKRALFRELETKVSDSALVATNTSSIELEELSAAFARPERFVGLHFFNPVASLQLVEVISAAATSAAALEKAMSFVSQIGKLPLPCRSAPGFVVNRILTPYMLEALRAHQDGHSFETIDAAASAFGMPTGPIELADRVGLDVALHVAKILSGVLRAEPPPPASSAPRRAGVSTFTPTAARRSARTFLRPTTSSSIDCCCRSSTRRSLASTRESCATRTCSTPVRCSAPVSRRSPAGR